MIFSRLHGVISQKKELFQFLRAMVSAFTSFYNAELGLVTILTQQFYENEL
jgi:hypothetical protein